MFTGASILKQMFEHTRPLCIIPSVSCMFKRLFLCTVGLSEHPVVFLSMSPGTTLHMCLLSVHQTLLHTIRSPRSFSSPHLHTSNDQRLEVGMAWDKAHSINWVVCLDFDNAGFIPLHQLVLTLSVLFIPFRQLSCVS